MKRRGKGMLILFSVIIGIIILFCVLDGSFLKKKYKRVWNSAYARTLKTDCEKVLAGAITASSSHNMQPWLVRIKSSTEMELYADLNKSLPVIDRKNRQTLISQGTFIEKFRESATCYGYETYINYSDMKIDGKKMKIADITIERKFAPKPVDIITSASFNYVEGEEESNIIDEIDRLSENFPGLEYEIIFVKDDSDIQSWLRKAYAVESGDEAAMKELLENFRFTEWDKTKYRYGLSLNTLPSVLMPFLQPVIKISAGNWESFGQSSIKMFDERLTKEFVYILIKAENPTRVDYIKTGEFYQAMTTAIKGYTLRPSVQLLEDFEAVRPLKDGFKKKYSPDKEIMLLIGIKKSELVNNPPIRHLVQDILID